jgi:hypothetical protein
MIRPVCLALALRVGACGKDRAPSQQRCIGSAVALRVRAWPDTAVAPAPTTDAAVSPVEALRSFLEERLGIECLGPTRGYELSCTGAERCSYSHEEAASLANRVKALLESDAAAAPAEVTLLEIVDCACEVF